MIYIFFTDSERTLSVNYTGETLKIDGACARIILDASHIIIIPLHRINRIEVIF